MTEGAARNDREIRSQCPSKLTTQSIDELSTMVDANANQENDKFTNSLGDHLFIL